MKHFITLVLTCFPLLCIGAPTYTTYFNNTHTYTNATIAGTNFAGRGVFTNSLSAAGFATSGTTNATLTGNLLANGATFTNGINAGAGTFTGAVGFNNGTITASAPIIDAGQGWNNGAVAFTGLRLSITNTASSASSKVIDLRAGSGGTTTMFSLDSAGTITAVGLTLSGGATIGAGTALTWSTRSQLRSPSDGTISMRNSAGTDFTFLGWGIGNATNAGIRRVSTTLEARNGDNTADATFVSQGAPLYEGKLATVSGVDLNVTTKSTIYTVPSGKSLVVTKVVVRNASTSLTTASFGFGFNANADDVVASALHTELTGSTLYTLIHPKVGAIRGAAADVFGLKCSIAQGSAATADVDLFGFFY